MTIASIDAHSLRWKHVEHLGKEAGVRLEDCINSIIINWVKEKVVGKSQVGLLVCENGPTEEYVEVVQASFRLSMVSRFLRRKSTEFIYAFDCGSCGRSATKAVYECLKAVYPEGNRLQSETRARVETRELRVGGGGRVELDGTSIADLKASGSLNGKLLVGSTKIRQTKRSRTQTLLSKVQALRLEKRSLLIVLDEANRFGFRSLSALAKTLRTNPDCKLLMLSQKNIGNPEVGFSDKLMVSYDCGLTGLMSQKLFASLGMSKEVVDYVLKIARGVPSKARIAASLVYGSHKARKRKGDISLGEATQALREWGGCPHVTTHTGSA